MWKSVINNSTLETSVKEKIEEISFVLDSISPTKEEGSGLLSGQSGILLFQAYYGLYSKTSKTENVEKSISNIYLALDKSPSFNFSNGLSGVLWTLNHLVSIGIIDIDEEIFKETSNFIHNDLIRQCDNDNYDYLHGAFGHIHYLTERKDIINSLVIKNSLKKFIDTSEFDQEKMFRKTIINFEAKQLGYCLGLAHGTPGTILILVKYLKVFPQDMMARDILVKSLNFLRSTKRKTPNPYYFPTYISNGTSERNYSGKLGWCYGDLGCALAILKAGWLLDEKDLIEEAISIFLFLTTCKGVEENHITDADFCHGTVGIAHFFGRLYNNTGLNNFKIASEYWYSKTMELARFNDGAGFKHYNGLKKDFVCYNGLLDGIAGIGLSLISSISSIEPKWDRALLLD